MARAASLVYCERFIPLLSIGKNCLITVVEEVSAPYSLHKQSSLNIRTSTKDIKIYFKYYSLCRMSLFMPHAAHQHIGSVHTSLGSYTVHTWEDGRRIQVMEYKRHSENDGSNTMMESWKSQKNTSR